ncbi:hypothetical protein EVAR_7431_1 [Eumeta japonica]|uniref:Uncharacterized protein n=1 Tax=Eumeta variegata TaxID=151549 RepID=A0A4C1V6A8_EUMVA|nr:hypothetical protein EVAR_7431_1 [Eumeta japonica]
MACECAGPAAVRLLLIWVVLAFRLSFMRGAEEETYESRRRPVMASALAFTEARARRPLTAIACRYDNESNE